MPLSWNRYGKSRVRLVKIKRAAAQHELVDLTIDVQLEGAFEKVYIDGDNSACHATDTMKNTVYALARQDPIDHVEQFALRLADHYIVKPAVTRVRVAATEHPWTRLRSHAFVQAGGENWTALVTRDAQSVEIVSGLTNLVVLKTTDSAFCGFPRDRYTTLPDAGERILATSVTASWTYRSSEVDFSAR